MRKHKVWNVMGSKHFYDFPANEIPKLEPVHYILGVSQMGFYLDRVEDTFELPKKIYGNDGLFAERVMKTWNARKKNVGVLLNGIKGSGKTVTSKTICNLSGLPVIMITQAYDGVEKFLASIDQDFIVFIDEYEKIYNRSDNMLTLMDGALSNKHRRLFLLTTNNTHVSEYMLDRPNRVLYRKSYDQVPTEVIEDMVDDLLVRKEWKDDLIRFFASLVTLTIDIIGNVIEEVNIHNELPEEFKEYFNVTQNRKSFNVYFHPTKLQGAQSENDRVLLAVNHTDRTNYNAAYIGRGLQISGNHFGVIKGVHKDGSLSITLYDKGYMKSFPKVLMPLAKKVVRISFEEQGYLVHQNYRSSFGGWHGAGRGAAQVADGIGAYDMDDDY